jgi:hypothetical protein
MWRLIDRHHTALDIASGLMLAASAAWFAAMLIG